MEKKETDTKNKNRNTKENQIEDQEIDWGEIDKMAKLVAKNLMGPTREEILKRKNRSAMGNHVCNCLIFPMTCCPKLTPIHSTVFPAAFCPVIAPSSYA